MDEKWQKKKVKGNEWKDIACILIGEMATCDNKHLPFLGQKEDLKIVILIPK